LILTLSKKIALRIGGFIPVGHGEKREGGGVMEKKRVRDRVCGAVKPICTCFSVAARQAREAEIDIPSKRRFRQEAMSEGASSAIPLDAGDFLHEVAARTEIGMRAFLDCVSDARNRVEQSRTDGLSRLSFRKLPE